ncbi:replication protein [Xenorhabdus bovienii]|uniref:replication protein n=2 Tax=Xenorhabdus bovienii TaxID=40576 RepID=UPI0023B31F62|nr:replication protein [Xenorhabdus bovienii]MDE9495718.1 replication protein [Xenorhabdus bovienii]MDE9504121.1 replication protein [Xenorhabdus bovienii]
MANIARMADYRQPITRAKEGNVNDDIEFIKTPRTVKQMMMLHSNRAITDRQYRIMDAIIDKTFGWHKRFDRITNTQIAAMISLHHTHVSTEINKLLQRKILVKQGNMIGINIETSEWIMEVSQNSKPLAKSANKRLAKTAKEDKPNQLNTKDTIKDNKEKIPLTPTGEENLALEILDYFNQLTRSRFQSTDPFLKALSTVKSKGQCYTADEIKLVIEWAVTQWKYGEKLKPENLCRMSRFDGYLSDAIKWKEKIDRNPVDCPHSELIALWNSKISARSVEVQEWTQRRPAYRNLESVWNGKTNKGKWREVQHMATCFDLISQSSLFSQVEEKPWLTLDWILKPENWSQVYEQAKREHITRRNGA